MEKLKPTQNILTYAENFDSCKNTFGPRNPRKTYDPRKMLTYVKYNFTHITHTTHVKI